MCLKTPKIDKPTAVQPAPDRSTVDTSNAKRRLASQQGAFGNIFTSALGDTGYGTNANKPKLATLGATV